MVKKKEHLDQIAPDTEVRPEKTVSLAGILIKTTLLSLVFTFVMLFITGIVAAGFMYRQFVKFTDASNTTPPEFIQMVRTAYETSPTATNGKKNFLVLGLDSLESRPGSPALSDTILLISVDLQTGKVNSLPLPRDIWSEAYQTKINALYVYGAERYPDRPEQFSEEVISELTGVPIHHTVLISLSSLEGIIDAVDGIEVDVPVGFSDSTFPKPDVDVTTVTDPEQLYQAITFEKGPQQMSGERALQYIRSRNSDTAEEATDVARNRRQQVVLTSLIQKITSRDVLFNPEIVAKLYVLYQETFEKQLPISEVLSTGFTLVENDAQPEMIAHNLPIFPEDENGVIEHPPVSEYNNQWVYRIIDPEKFSSTVRSLLGMQVSTP